MTLIEATRTGRPLTRKNKTWCYINEMSYFALRNPTYILPNNFIDPEYFFSKIKLTQEDILAKDWIIKDDLTEKDFETVPG